MEHEWDLMEEEKAMAALRKVVDRTAALLLQPGLDETEAVRLMEATRQWVIKVFPGKEPVYDLIYRPRFDDIFYGSRTE